MNLYGHYETIPFDAQGRLWSEEVGAWVGLWDGVYQGEQGRWVRFFDLKGNPLLTAAEAKERLAETERARAEAEHARAEKAEAEAARLREELERLKKAKK